MKINHDLYAWRKKYNAGSLDEVLYPKDVRTRKLLKTFIQSHNFVEDGMILCGEGGTGKTTFVELIMQDPYWQVTVLDPSGEGIDRIVGLKNTLSCVPWGGAQKHLVVCNELSSSSSMFREALRGVLDDFSEVAFFIFTDNKYDKLAEQNPQVFNDERIYKLIWDDLDKADIKKMCVEILTIENCLPETDRDWALLDALIDKNYPSLRKTVAKLDVQFRK